MIIVNPNAVQSTDNEAKQGEIPVNVEQTNQSKPKAARKPRKAKAAKAIVPVCTDIAVIPQSVIAVEPVAEIAAQEFEEEEVKPKVAYYASVDVSRRLFLETVKLAAKASGKVDLVLHVTTDGYLRVVGGVHTDAMLVTRIPAAGRLNDISIGTNAAKLLKVLNRLSGEQVNLELTLGEQGLTIRGNAGEFILATREMAYPEIVLDELLASFALTKGALASQIKSVMYAVAHNDVRYYLNGVCLNIEYGQVFVVGTDGNRLALSKSLTRVDTEDKDVKSIIPSSALKTLLPLLESDILGSVRVMVNEEYARIAINNNVTLFVRLVDGFYPCYQSVIPDESRAQTVISVERAALLKAVDSAEVLANEKYKGVRISNDGSLLKITSRNPDKEVARKLLPVSITGDDQEFEVAVNACYLSDVLKHIDDDVVDLRLYGANNSMLIKPHHGLTSVQAVIMPMRL